MVSPRQRALSLQPICGCHLLNVIYLVKAAYVLNLDFQELEYFYVNRKKNQTKKTRNAEIGAAFNCDKNTAKKIQH